MCKRAMTLGLVMMGIFALIVGCATAPEKEKEAPKVKEESLLPDWVINPTIEGGIAASECTNWTGDISLDKAEAVASARASLAKQIYTRVEAMDKVYKRKVRTEEGSIPGGTFESVSKQVTKQYLKGSRPIKAKIVTIEGKKHFCVMCAMDPTTTRKLFDKIIEQSKAPLSPKDERILYEEFRAQKAHEELEKEMEEME